MPDERSQETYFAVSRFTANLQPGDANYTKAIVAHTSDLRAMGYAGFDLPIAPTDGRDRAAEVASYAAFKRALDDAGLNDVAFAQEGGVRPTPDEVLPLVALIGDDRRFTRQDSVEEPWRILQPLLDAPPPLHPYAKGSWGPVAADCPVAGDGGWHDAWVLS